MARGLYSGIAAMFSSWQRQFERLLMIAGWNSRRDAAAGTGRDVLPLVLPVASH